MSEAVADLLDFIPEMPEAGFGAVALIVALLAIARGSWRPSHTRANRSNLTGAAGLVLALRSAAHQIIASHDRLYEWICGAHPHRLPWHFQWLSVKDLYRDLRRTLPHLEGALLDVGCLGKPYAGWMKRVSTHVGVDVSPGITVDRLIRDGEPWPLPTGSFQSVLCSQVLQVVKNLPHLLGEMDRVLARDGIAIIAAPFCYNDMSVPCEGGLYKDYWRHSVHGIEELVRHRFEVIEIRRQGGVGSTTGQMLLNWIRLSLCRRLATHLLFVLLFPLWLPFCLLVNTTGWLLDRLDRTEAFYHNVFLVIRKQGDR